MNSNTASQTLGEVLQAIRGWSDCSADQRRDFVRACQVVEQLWHQHVGRMVSLHGAFERTLTFDCPCLNSFLFCYPASAVGLKKRSFANLLSHLRDVLRRLGRHDDDRPGKSQFDPEWQAFYDPLPTRWRKSGLVGFMQFCSARGIKPGDADASALDRFERWLAERTLCEDSGEKSRRTASNWNWAADNVECWPKIRLVRPGMRDEFTPRLECYPVPFQQDVEAFLQPPTPTVQGSSHVGKIFTLGVGSRPTHRASAQATIGARRWLIRLIAAAVVESGVPMENLTALRDLVDPVERPWGALEFLGNRHIRKRYEETGAESNLEELRNGQLANVADLMRQIAQFHCGMPQDQVAQFTTWRDGVAPVQKSGMSDRNAAVLRGLMAPRTYANFLHLPEIWMRRLDEERRSLAKPVKSKKIRSPRRIAQDQALTVMYAVAL